MDHSTKKSTHNPQGKQRTLFIISCLILINLSKAKIVINNIQTPKMYAKGDIDINLKSLIDLSQADFPTFKTTTSIGKIGWNLQYDSSTWHKQPDLTSFRLQAIDDFGAVVYSWYDDGAQNCILGTLAGSGEYAQFTDSFQTTRTACSMIVGNSIYQVLGKLFFISTDIQREEFVFRYSGNTKKIVLAGMAEAPWIDFIVRGSSDPKESSLRRGFIYKTSSDPYKKYGENSLIKFDVEADGTLNYKKEIIFDQAIDIQWISCANQGEDSPSVFCWVLITENQQKKFTFIKRIDEDQGTIYKRLFDIPISNGIIGIDKNPFDGWSQYLEIDADNKTMNLCDITLSTFKIDDYTTWKTKCTEAKYDLNLEPGKFVSSVKVKHGKAVFNIRDRKNLFYYGYEIRIFSQTQVLPSLPKGKYFFYSLLDFKGVFGLDFTDTIPKQSFITSSMRLKISKSEKPSEGFFDVKVSFEDTVNSGSQTLQFGFIDVFNPLSIKKKNKNLMEPRVFQTDFVQEYTHYDYTCQGDYIKVKTQSDSNLFATLNPYYTTFLPNYPIYVSSQNKVSQQNRILGTDGNLSSSRIDMRITEWSMTVTLTLALGQLSSISILKEGALPLKYYINHLEIKAVSATVNLKCRVFIIQEDLGTIHFLKFDNKTGTGDYRIRTLKNVDANQIMSIKNVIIPLNDDQIQFNKLSYTKELVYSQIIDFSACYLALKMTASVIQSTEVVMTISDSTAVDSERNVSLSVVPVPNPNIYNPISIYKAQFNGEKSTNKFNLNYYYHFKSDSHGIDLTYPITSNKKLKGSLKLTADKTLSGYSTTSSLGRVKFIKKDLERKLTILAYQSTTKTTVVAFKNYKKTAQLLQTSDKITDLELLEASNGSYCMLGLNRKEIDNKDWAQIWTKFGDDEVQKKQYKDEFIKIRLVKIGADKKAMFLGLTTTGLLKLYSFTCGNLDDIKLVDSVGSDVTSFEISLYTIKLGKFFAISYSVKSEQGLLNIYTLSNMKILTSVWKKSSCPPYIDIIDVKPRGEDLEILIESEFHQMSNLLVSLKLTSKDEPDSNQTSKYYMETVKIQKYSTPTAFKKFSCISTENFIACVTNARILDKYVVYNKYAINFMVWAKKAPFSTHKAKGFTYRLQSLSGVYDTKGILQVENSKENVISLITGKDYIQTIQLQNIISIEHYPTETTKNYKIDDFSFNFRGNTWTSSVKTVKGTDIMVNVEGVIKDLNFLRKTLWGTTCFLIFAVLCYFGVKLFQKKPKTRSLTKMTYDSVIVEEEEEYNDLEKNLMKNDATGIDSELDIGRGTKRGEDSVTLPLSFTKANDQALS